MAPISTRALASPCTLYLSSACLSTWPRGVCTQAGRRPPASPCSQDRILIYIASRSTTTALLPARLLASHARSTRAGRDPCALTRSSALPRAAFAPRPRCVSTGPGAPAPACVLLSEVCPEPRGSRFACACRASHRRSAYARCGDLSEIARD